MSKGAWRTPTFTAERWSGKIQQLQQCAGEAAPDTNNTKPMSNNQNTQPPVDAERLMEFSDGTVESLRELINLYLDQTRKQVDQLHAAIAGGNAPEVRRIAHSSAGASATCGMVTMSPLLRELEHLGHEEQLAGAAGLAAQVEHEFARVREQLENILASPPQVAAQL